jgi:hypothetical protein
MCEQGGRINSTIGPHDALIVPLLFVIELL